MRSGRVVAPRFKTLSYVFLESATQFSVAGLLVCPLAHGWSERAFGRGAGA